MDCPGFAPGGTVILNSGRGAIRQLTFDPGLASGGRFTFTGPPGPFAIMIRSSPKLKGTSISIASGEGMACVNTPCPPAAGPRGSAMLDLGSGPSERTTGFPVGSSLVTSGR
eukprot:CAMPEP_0206433286 /NCGR_PEP_ID=MMETSP0324_2-20121206/8443_1 /ASSEMBLY_ACC=CAM_ASM_000836 /TAXON_ID=2866 /ORGANISM="Crypthecodinium cohnii, Strain Seligo" /LENGTH=111 /DNA_ID=CAMNT_0053899523 /DNA_START=434 /DNA_END=769 /DNA_ORIENTATION=-